MQLIHGLSYDYLKLHKNYLMILINWTDFETKPLIAMQVQMMQHNRIPGLLPFELEQADAQIQLRFDITDRRMLTHELRRNRSSVRDLLHMLMQITSILIDSAYYMLNEGHYLIHSDFMFIDEENEQILLTYVPVHKLENKRPVSVELLNLMAPWTNAADPDYSEWITISHYLESESFTLRGLKQRLLQLKHQTTTMPDSLPLQSADSAMTMPPAASVWKPMPVAPLKRGTWLKAGIWRRFTQYLTTYMHTVQHNSSTQGQVSRLVPQIAESLLSQTTYLTPLNSTVLLSQEILKPAVIAKKGVAVPKAYIQMNGITDSTPVPVPDEGLILGKGPNGVHHQIDEIGVSRIHLEIKREGETYRLMDLGSKNGTYLNENLVVPYKSYPLTSGDCIRVLRNEFIFSIANDARTH